MLRNISCVYILRMICFFCLFLMRGCVKRFKPKREISLSFLSANMRTSAKLRRKPATFSLHLFEAQLGKFTNAFGLTSMSLEVPENLIHSLQALANLLCITCTIVRNYMLLVCHVKPITVQLTRNLRVLNEALNFRCLQHMLHI